jgi:hypothetical protein
VRKRFINKGTLLLIFSISIISSLTFALDKDKIAIQGVVMELDLKKNVMIVNERAFFWDPQTIFYNEKGSPITVDQLRAKTWVYIEGMRDNVKKRAIAGKIYLLPKYINEKEKHLYPFIQ